MRVVEALQVSQRGLVVVTDVKLRDVGALGVSLQQGISVSFCDPSGRKISSTLSNLEIFSSPFNPNKPFAFVVSGGVSKSDLPPGTEIEFIVPSA